MVVSFDQRVALERHWEATADPQLVAAWIARVPNEHIRATRSSDRGRFQQGWEAHERICGSSSKEES